MINSLSSGSVFSLHCGQGKDKDGVVVEFSLYRLAGLSRLEIDSNSSMQEVQNMC